MDNRKNPPHHADLTIAGSNDALQIIAHQIINEANSSVLGMYIFDLSTGNFNLVCASGFAFLDSFHANDIGVFRSLIKHEINEIHEMHARRGSQLICVVFCEANSIDTSKLNYYLNYIPFIYNRMNADRLIQGIYQPIPFESDDDTYYKHLRDLAKNSAGTQFGAFRVLKGDRLNCIFSWGFDEYIDNNDDLSIDCGAIPPLEDAISSRNVQYVKNIQNDFPEIRENYGYLKDIKSFCAAPVIVGDNVNGVFSVASSIEYGFTTSEMNGFLCIANGIGVSVNNFRLNWQGKSEGAEFEKISSSITGVEVAQAIRHSIYNSAGAIITDLSSLESSLLKLKLASKEKEFSARIIRRIEESANSINTEVKNMKDAMSIDRILKLTCTKTLWSECIRHLSHRIDDSEIHIGEVKRHDDIPMIANIVKKIFYNLLLNSLDAFDGRSRNESREISLKVSNIDTRYRKLYLTYMDNGPGINVSSLEATRSQLVVDKRVRDIDESTPIGELIFRQGVTSKREGSGHGLWLCRRLARYHGGGIQYRTPHDSKGVIFDIELSFDVFDLVKENPHELFYYVDETKQLVDPESYLNFIKNRKWHR